MKKWIEGIREHASPYVVIVIVGNKLDLRKTSEQAVTANEGKKLAASLGVLFAETSAILNENVESTFNMMLECIHTSIQKYRSARNSKALLIPPRAASPSQRTRQLSLISAVDVMMYTKGNPYSRDRHYDGMRSFMKRSD